MSKSKDLGGDVVGAIHKDERGILVDKGETLEFFRVEYASVVVAYDAVENEQYAGLVQSIAQKTEWRRAKWIPPRPNQK